MNEGSVIVAFRNRCSVCHKKTSHGNTSMTLAYLAGVICQQLGLSKREAARLLRDVSRSRGTIRSLEIYYAPDRAARLDAFHRRFLDPGNYAFDIGAHVGDRTASFLRLGAHAVAVEPQPDLAGLLRRIFGHRATVVEALAGATSDIAELHLNTTNPTIATASQDFIAAAYGSPGWEDQQWVRKIVCDVVTLDALVAMHGAPEFIKVDVEGWEDVVLHGLSMPVRTLSFEFTTIHPQATRRALARLTALGYHAFNACIGESMSFAHGTPQTASAILAWLVNLPLSANSGDVYASLEPKRLRAVGEVELIPAT
jgi:FkbM family methyltransferase